jgi:hypothetical protein
MSYDTAAALSQVPIPRSQWGHVHFYPRADGQPWTMTITPKRHMRADGTVRTHAYDITVQIPGVEGPGSGAEEVLDDLSESDIDYDVGYEPTGR